MHVVIMIGSMGTAGAWRRPGNWINQFSFEKYAAGEVGRERQD